MDDSIKTDIFLDVMIVNDDGMWLDADNEKRCCAAEHERVICVEGNLA